VTETTEKAEAKANDLGRPQANRCQPAKVRKVAGIAQFIINLVLQVFGSASAIIFGVWAVKSFNVANAANDLSNTVLGMATTANSLGPVGNQLSLLSLCILNSASLGVQYSL